MLRIAIKRKWKGQPLDGSNRNEGSSSEVKFDVESQTIPDFGNSKVKTSTINKSKIRSINPTQFDSGFDSYGRGDRLDFRPPRFIRQSTTVDDDFGYTREPLVSFRNPGPPPPPRVPQP